MLLLLKCLLTSFTLSLVIVVAAILCDGRQPLDMWLQRLWGILLAITGIISLVLLMGAIWFSKLLG